jgi:hypothetical protein
MSDSVSEDTGHRLVDFGQPRKDGGPWTLKRRGDENLTPDGTPTGNVICAECHAIFPEPNARPPNPQPAR